MKLRPRLIPAVIIAATVLLGVKVSDIFGLGGHALAQSPSQNAPATGAPIDLTKQANAAAAPPPANQINPQAGGDAAAAANGTPAPASNAAQAAPAAADGKSAPPSADTSAANAASRAPLKDPLLLSPAEIEILQELSQRRTDLDKRAADVQQQQIVLEAAEKRIDDKIAKLQDLQKSIQGTVDKQNAAEDARMQSLVKIYETMKPADAAQILSQLDMPILLQMLSHMKEAKTAPILAAMDPSKAQAITAAMAMKQPQTAQAAPVAAGQ